MYLPNHENAIADIAKLRDYCLNPNHLVGKHKAAVFLSALGFNQSDAERLQKTVLEAAQSDQAVLGERDDFGQRYQLDFVVVGPKGLVNIRTAWIILQNETVPRLATAYVLTR